MEFGYPNKRAEKIIDSSLERVADRVERFASDFSGVVGFPLTTIIHDSAPEGCLRFHLVNDQFKILDTETHERFLNFLPPNDIVINQDNARITSEAGFEPFIEIEPRKNMQ